MPVAKIEYDLSDPDDSLASARATKALDMALALSSSINIKCKTYAKQFFS